ncbi:hypothetical protein N9V13_03030 [Betaproteobacteria bacterium]|nr:hypothetical protein [Betaproteobacteria bacterium]
MKFDKYRLEEESLLSADDPEEWRVVAIPGKHGNSGVIKKGDTFRAMYCKKDNDCQMIKIYFDQTIKKNA